MKNFADFIKETYDIEIPKGNIPGSWFIQNHIPMIVRCSCCEMTMASPSAWINDDGYTFCADCAGVSES
jgi:hypothetical protein